MSDSLQLHQHYLTGHERAHHLFPAHRSIGKLNRGVIKPRADNRTQVASATIPGRVAAGDGRLANDDLVQLYAQD